MEDYKNGHYYSLNEYLQKNFGCKVYKLALDGGFTCPNRDGKIDTRGCIFCSNGGSGEFAQRDGKSISEQINLAKERVSGKIKNGKYIAYFQAFTNTYAPTHVLRNIFTQAVLNESIVALSIATRPDCLPNDTVVMLGELNKIKPVWVELGLQTIHEKTAEYIRRGYSLDVFDEAMAKIKKYSLTSVVHVILGLPGENTDDMLKSVDYVAHCGANGIKLQLLHVLENTDLAKDYRRGRFDVLTMEEYIDILCDCIEILPKDIVIHRLTGDGAKKILIAPKWSGNKKMVLNAINRTLKERNIIQGSKYYPKSVIF